MSWPGGGPWSGGRYFPLDDNGGDDSHHRYVDFIFTELACTRATFPKYAHGYAPRGGTHAELLGVSL